MFVETTMAGDASNAKTTVPKAVIFSLKYFVERIPIWFLQQWRCSYIKLECLNSFLLPLFSFGLTTEHIAESMTDRQVVNTVNKHGNTSSLCGHNQERVNKLGMQK